MCASKASLRPSPALRSAVKSTQRRARSWAPTGLRMRRTASQPCPQPRCRCGHCHSDCRAAWAAPSPPHPRRLLPLQAELLATLGQVSSLRTSASAQAAEVSRWRDLKLEASTLLEALRQGKGRLTAEQIDLVSDSLDRAAAAAAAAGSGGGPDAGVTAGGSSSSDAAVAALRSQLVAEKGRSEALRAQVGGRRAGCIMRAYS